MGRLDGKVAIVSGAARGTGESIARLFAEEGARVVLADVRDDLGEQVAKQIGDAALYVHLDVTREEDWKNAVETSVGHFGGVDVLVNNAALLHLAAIEDTTAQDFERLVAVNQIGTFLGIKSVAPAMKDAGRGSIVNIASIDGLRGQNGVVAYASTKWAVRGITRVAAVELGRFGIRVNAVCPEAGSGEMMAPFIPDGIDVEKVASHSWPLLATQKERRIADRVRDVAKMALFLASDDSASCTASDFPVEGGNSTAKLTRGAPGS